MGSIPFLGRLDLYQYFALLLSIVLIFAESIIAVITFALPTPIIRFCYRGSRRIFNHYTTPQTRRSENKKSEIVSSISQAQDFVELCELFGYEAEEHIVQTGDGYLLGVHRISGKLGEDGSQRDRKDGIKKKVVYLHHGLMMNSDVWVCLTEKERCLPFILAEQGYDVWLGNNRGNKYSKKNIHHAPTEVRFWNFSIDDFAFYDIPDSINYILSITGEPSLSYVGFSQGTAQAFATLSIHPNLNEKVDVFVALAPAMSPKGLTSGIVDSIMKASPDFIFLAFGRRAILGSATMWQAILFPPIFVRLIDISLKFLFGWTSRNITPHQKLAAYPHLYSFTSTKSVVHWFQIIRNGVFQMYDDELQQPRLLGNGAKYYKVAKFPTRNIKTPIVLVYGGSDSLVDIRVMLKELPRHTQAKEIPHYEHLDFLWGSHVDTLVFPHVLEALAVHTEKDEAGHRVNPTRYNEINVPLSQQIEKFTAPTSSSSGGDTDMDADEYAGESDLPSLVHRRSPESYQNDHSSRQRMPIAKAKTSGRSRRQLPPSATSKNSTSPANSASQATEMITTSRPEGWWSSDDVGTRPSSPEIPLPVLRSTWQIFEPRQRRSTGSPVRWDRLHSNHVPLIRPISLSSKQTTDCNDKTQVEPVQMDGALTTPTRNSFGHVHPFLPAEEALEPLQQHKTPSHSSIRSTDTLSPSDSIFGKRGISLGVGKAVGGLMNVEAMGVRGSGRKREDK